MEEQKKAKLTAKNKGEFEKGLKKIGFDIINYASKQKSPNNWNRKYELNYKDIAGVVLEMDFSKSKDQYNGDSILKWMGATFESLMFYDNVSEFYDQLLSELKSDFDLTINEANDIKKKFSNTLFTKKDSAQLGLFGLKGQINISTKDFQKMKVGDLKRFTLNYYEKFLKDRKIAIKNSLKKVQFINKAGRKIAYGGSMYSAKAAIIEHLEEIIKNSTYNNWGNRKPKDHKDVLGYLNFKSKVKIDGEKRHVRISVEVYKNRETLLKNYDAGKKEKKGDLLSKGSKRVPSVEESKSPSSKGTKKPHSKTKKASNEGSRTSNKKVTKKSDKKKKGLKSPDYKPVESENISNGVTSGVPQIDNFAIETLPSPVPEESPKANKVKSLADAMQENTSNESYNIPGDIGRFLGKVEIKPVHSVVTTLDAEQGSGKTRFLFEVMNALAGQGYKCLFYSLEEHPASQLFKDKVKQYIQPENLSNISVIDEVENWDDEKTNIEDSDITFIDSFQKLPGIDLDQDIRKAFNGKWFFIIYQRTGTKTMRGGSKAAFDGDQILKVEKFPDYRENNVYANKNRYNSIPELKFNIFSQRLVGENIPDLPEEEVTNSSDLPPEKGRLIATPII